MVTHLKHLMLADNHGEASTSFFHQMVNSNWFYILLLLLSKVLKSLGAIAMAWAVSKASLYVKLGSWNNLLWMRVSFIPQTSLSLIIKSNVPLKSQCSQIAHNSMA